jgi:hypothetical protein
MVANALAFPDKEKKFLFKMVANTQAYRDKEKKFI